MGSSRALILLRGLSPPSSAVNHGRHLHRFSRISPSEVLIQKQNKWVQSYSVKSSLEPPDLTRLAKTAHISLTPTEVEEFTPKIQQVLDWKSFGVNGTSWIRMFGQLQAVDLESIEPAVRAGTDVGTFREDLPETFENREAMIAAVPSYDEPFIHVPKVLNKE